MTTQQLIDRLGRTRSTLASWQFGQLAVFFVVLLFLLPILHHGVLIKSITTLFVINSLLVADSNNPNARELRWIGWSLAIIAGVSNVLEELHLSEALTFATKYVAITSHALLFLFCAASILGIVFRMRRITLDGILASVVVYELIGLVFAQIYTLARLIDPVSLQMPPSVAAEYGELPSGDDLLQFRHARDARVRRHRAGYQLDAKRRHRRSRHRSVLCRDGGCGARQCIRRTADARSNRSRPMTRVSR